MTCRHQSKMDCFLMISLVYKAEYILGKSPVSSELHPSNLSVFKLPIACLKRPCTEWMQDLRMRLIAAMSREETLSWVNIDRLQCCNLKMQSELTISGSPPKIEKLVSFSEAKGNTLPKTSLSFISRRTLSSFGSCRNGRKAIQGKGPQTIRFFS